MGADALNSGPSADVIVIDEIGKMECLSTDFAQAARRALSGPVPVPVLATIAFSGGGFIADAKRMPGVELSELTRENRDRAAQRDRGAAHRRPGLSRLDASSGDSTE